MLNYEAMELETILLEKEGKRGIITLNRPDVLNSINDRLLAELEYAFTQCDKDENIRIVLLKSAGTKSFCSGIDIKWVKDKTPTAPR